MSAHHRGRGWARIRAAALERDGYRCRLCGRPGRLEVDHIRPVRTFPAGQRGERPGQADHPDNLRALCRPCHRDITRAQSGRPPDPDWAAMLTRYGGT